MANNRITWQNIDAPDLRDALLGTELSGSMFGKAADTFSDAMNAFAKNRKDRVNAKAMDSALRIGDAQAFDAALQGQGLGAFGIAPEDASAELLNFVLGRRGELVGAEADDLSLERGQWQFGRDQAQAPLQDAQAALNYKRKDSRFDAEFDKTQATAAAQAEAAELAYKMGQDLPPAERERAVRALGLGSVVEPMVLSALGNQPDIASAIDPKIAGTSNLQGDFALAREAISTRERELNARISNSPLMQLYDQGTQKADGYKSPVDGVVDRLRGRLDPGVKDPESVMGRNVGELNNIFKKWQDYAKGVPPSVVAEVIENNLTKTGIGGFWDGELKPDSTAIRLELDKMKDPAQINQFNQQLSAVERERNEIREALDIVVSSETEYEWSLSNNKPGLANQALSRVRKLNTNYLTSSPPAPAPASAKSAPRGRGASGRKVTPPPAPERTIIRDGELTIPVPGPAENPVPPKSWWERAFQ